MKVWDGDESQGLDKLEKRMDILNYLFEGCFVVLFLQQAFSYLSGQERRRKVQSGLWELYAFLFLSLAVLFCGDFRKTCRMK